MNESLQVVIAEVSNVEAESGELIGPTPSPRRPPHVQLGPGRKAVLFRGARQNPPARVRLCSASSAQHSTCPALPGLSPSSCRSGGWQACDCGVGRF